MTEEEYYQLDLAYDILLNVTHYQIQEIAKRIYKDPTTAKPSEIAKMAAYILLNLN